MPYTPETFANNVVTTVAGGAGGAGTALNATDTTLLLPAGVGARLPAAGPCRMQLGVLSGVYEIVTFATRSGDTLSGMVRGLEGTTALTWAFGTPVQQVATAGSLAGVYAAINSGRPYFVDDYGAKGDGSTDDTTAMQAATEAARLAGGGTVSLRQGAVYIVHLTVNPNVAGISAALHLGTNCTLEMNGATIKLGNNQALDQQRVISNWNPQASGTDKNIRIRNGIINGNAANQTGVTGLDICDGIHIRYARDIRIEGVISKNNWGTTNGPNGPGGTGGEVRNILCWWCADIVYLNCEAYEDDGGHSSGGIGAYNSFGVHMDSCTVHDMVYSWGIAIFECNDFSLTNCISYNNTAGPGFLVEDSNYGTIGACIAGGLVPTYGQAGPLAASTQFPNTYGFEVFGCTAVVLEDCVSLYASVSGFSLADATIPAITENNITLIGCMSAFSTSHGFSLVGAGYDYTLVGCTAFNNTSRGILVQTTGTTGRNKIAGCRAINNGIGFQVDATPLLYTSMRDCEALGNTTQATFGGVNTTTIEGHLTAPAVPASPASLTNPFPFPVTVYVFGGTVTVVSVDGTTVATATSATVPVTVRLPAGKTIGLTYSVAPTWVWVAD